MSESTISSHPVNPVQATITLTASGIGLAQASVDLTSQAVRLPPLPAGIWGCQA